MILLRINASIGESETLSMYDGSAGFLIFGLCDPHGLEGRKRAQDRSSDPYKEFSFSRGNNLDLHG